MIHAPFRAAPSRFFQAAALLGFLSAASFAAPAKAADDFGGLPAGKGQEETFFSCTACHSSAIIMEQRLNRRVWDEVLTWMVDEKGMPALEAPQRAIVLDYLVRHFGQDVPR